MIKISRSLILLFISIFFLLIHAAIFSQQAWAKIRKEKLYSPLRVQIILKKDSFRVGETIDGMVRIKNSYIVSLPAMFTIKLFHDGKKFSEDVTSVKSVPFGKMDLTFKTFSIPEFNDQPGAEGTWKIVIVQKDMDESYAGEAVLSIVPPAIKKDKTNTRKRTLKYYKF